eukprot:4728804-Pyramimonas_sp.AAC.1
MTAAPAPRAIRVHREYARAVRARGGLRGRCQRCALRRGMPLSRAALTPPPAPALPRSGRCLVASAGLL